MSSGSKAMPVVRQLALAAVRPSALRAGTPIEATPAGIFTASTTSALQQRRHASQLSTPSNISSLPHDHLSEVVRCIQALC